MGTPTCPKCLQPARIIVNPDENVSVCTNCAHIMPVPKGWVVPPATRTRVSNVGIDVWIRVPATGNKIFYIGQACAIASIRNQVAYLEVETVLPVEVHLTPGLSDERRLVAAILAAEDECITYSEAHLQEAQNYTVQQDSLPDEKATILTLRKK